MYKSIAEIEKIPVHFILCTERTGSSLLSLMLNLHPKIICTSEELFAVYFYKKYKNKTIWTDEELSKYVNEFWLMAEQDINLYFTTKEKFLLTLQQYKSNLNYQTLVKLTYLQFIEPKPKSEVEIIIDKQIKYLFYLPLLLEIFPTAKFVILIRDVRDNIVSKIKRSLNLKTNPFFLSSIWHYTYLGVNYLIQNKKNIYIIKYENLVADPEAEIKLLCDFFGLEYLKSMINTSGVYEAYLEDRKPYLKPEEYNRIKKFNNELLSEVNTRKIGTYKNILSEDVTQKIVFQNKDLLNYFGYNVSETKPVNFSLNDRLNKFLAYLYRPLLLRFYLAIPFWLKIMIKKSRKRAD